GKDQKQRVMLRVELAKLSAQIDAIKFGHLPAGHYQLGLLVGKKVQCGCHSLDGVRFEIHFAQGSTEPAANLRQIRNDESLHSVIWQMGRLAVDEVSTSS